MACWLLAYLPVLVRGFTVAVGSLKLNGRAHSRLASKYIADAMCEMNDVAWRGRSEGGGSMAQSPCPALRPSVTGKRRRRTIGGKRCAFG